ncbi:sigma-70 family RNA polymerase sigma factor [Fibrella forsythiae]|uniref:Sigma-70 family RNA polymerase sigma factor n=1 Tax=Fibrella forsythiae TaxID=2817061 RepID=A0ABS3JTP2_9BACT|nr:sigma-70 family RNA polymerase sigma factor [Fibrella forsythiae]MBO0953318.1 sigma-70 family RNA polymerase sigma factor [Fibrella forsythiae]
MCRPDIILGRDRLKKSRFLPLERASATDYYAIQDDSSLEERWNQALATLSRLPPGEQQLLQRRYMGNQSIEQLATNSCLSQSAIKMRLKRPHDQARLLYKRGGLALN